MKVNLFISDEIKESYCDIHTNKLTDNITKAINILENRDSKDIIAVKKDDDIVFLKMSDIYMLKFKDKRVKVFSENKEYEIRKALYKVESELNSDFIRISKTTIINLRYVKRVTPSFKGMMFIQLENGLKDNISRRYLPDFKNTLGL